MMAIIAHSGQSCAMPNSTAPTCKMALAADAPLLTRLRDSGVDTAALAAICSTIRTRSESKISRAWDGCNECLAMITYPLPHVLPELFAWHQYALPASPKAP